MEPGLAQLLRNPTAFLGPRERCALLCNQASVTQDLEHAAPLLQRVLGSRLVRLFSPQHGYYGEKQDNMVLSDDTLDPLTGLQVVSLYGKVLRPPPETLQDIDVLLVDLPDVGTRVYTFINTVIECMRVAESTSTRVVVLDRPNPIGGVIVEGPRLQPEFRSFVGQLPVPLRHGLTIGELARCACNVFELRVDLTVVSVDGWNRGHMWWDCAWEWVMPSPNLPTPLSCLVYPGTVLFEGTNISEGRGTTRPFEILGAPFVDPVVLVDALPPACSVGCRLRPLWFEPTYNKWAGQRCGGVQIHVLDRHAFRPIKTAIALLATIRRLWPDEFRWKNPPYEFDHVRMPIDLIAGTDRLRLAIDSGETAETILASFNADLEAYKRDRSKWLLY